MSVSTTPGATVRAGLAPASSAATTCELVDRALAAQ